MHIDLIVDLGFGDAGKGLITDFLVRQSKAGLVVRYNGGAQAGHNVVTPDGLHHTFSQFGSGTFVPGVKTYLSKFMVLHPTALLLEGDRLAALGVKDAFARLRISCQCPVITPFHQAANRIRELMRGESRHGSCGVGVGETVEDARSMPENTIFAGDLNQPTLLRRKLNAISGQKRDLLVSEFGENKIKQQCSVEWRFFEQEEIIDAWISAVAGINKLGLVVADDWLRKNLARTGNAVFEGAQGVLLDAEAGFYPYNSWSNSTTRSAVDLIRELAPSSSVRRIGVLRSHVVRHGPGPLPTETAEIIPLVSEHNNHNEWQGSVRYGWFDSLLACYALAETGGVDLLAITHLDLLAKLPAWKYCIAYHESLGDQPLKKISALPSQIGFSYEEKSAFTRRLQNVSPVYEECAPDQKTVIEKIKSLSGVAVGFVSNGQKSTDVRSLEIDLK